MEATRSMLIDRLGAAAVVRGEEVLAEIPGAVRRLGLLLMVLAVAIPAFLAACLGVLAWWLMA